MGRLSRLAVLRPEFSCNPEVDQGVYRFIRNQVYIATITAITAIGPASFNEFFTPKTQTTVATVACLNPNACFVDEFHEYRSLPYDLREIRHLLRFCCAVSVDDLYLPACRILWCVRRARL